MEHHGDALLERDGIRCGMVAREWRRLAVKRSKN
jgi:hypothetical protein